MTAATSTEDTGVDTTSTSAVAGDESGEVAVLSGSMTFCSQRTFTVRVSRGVEDVTRLFATNPDVAKVRVGLCHLLLKHTSASLVLSRGDDSTRREAYALYNSLVPVDRGYSHSYEGDDDMPGHGKCVLLGTDLTIPISDGKLNLGESQAVWLCEHRDGTHRRNVIATVSGVPYTT